MKIIGNFDDELIQVVEIILSVYIFSINPNQIIGKCIKTILQFKPE